ncbi:cytochrome b6 [Sulfolobales archaeon HS-7]|nr:cytochrome b6 [Sulfolobales archaeon HS-7]
MMKTPLLILDKISKGLSSIFSKIGKGANPKDTLGVVWLYTLGSVAWLMALGIAAMNMRTYLVNDANSPSVGPVYYTALTLHGWGAMLGFVPNAALAVIAYSLYKSGMSIRHVKLMAALFWISNLALVFAMLGGPDMGWYMYPPLAIEDNAVFRAFLIYTGKMIGVAYTAMAVEAILQTVASIVLVVDAYQTKPKGERINIFAAYGVAFAIIIAMTLPALAGAELWYALYFFFPRVFPVDSLLWVILFWFYGHPVVYYVPFPLFGALYYFVPKYANRELFSEKWARWNIYLLAIGSMLIWVHHLQTWPLPVPIRLWVNLSTLVLASGSGLTVLNLGLTILFSKGYNFRDPIGMTFLIALIGFILGGIQAIFLPENPINPIVHDTYYIVGHFHLIIWTLIVMGFTGVFLDMLKSTLPGFNYSERGSKLMIIGALLWTVPFLLVGYLMSTAGYLGLIRRVIAYAPMFQPYMEGMSLLAEIGIPGLVIVLTTAISEYVAYSASRPTGVTVASAGLPSVSAQEAKDVIDSNANK